MPQKRNPDYAELVRARSGTVYGALMSVLSICKALPYSYNRDLQEVTPHLLRATKSTTASLAVMAAMMEGLEVKLDEMEKKAPVGFTAATELADTIVRKTGLSFRTAHKIISSAVSLLGDEHLGMVFEHTSGQAAAAEILRYLDELALSIIGKELSELGLTEKEVQEALDITSTVQKRKAKGGPAKKEVQRMIERRRSDLERDEKVRQEREDRVRRSVEELEREVKKKQRKRAIRVIKKPGSTNRAEVER